MLDPFSQQHETYNGGYFVLSLLDLATPSLLTVTPTARLEKTQPDPTAHLFIHKPDISNSNINNNVVNNVLKVVIVYNMISAIYFVIPAPF